MYIDPHASPSKKRGRGRPPRLRDLSAVWGVSPFPSPPLETWRAGEEEEDPEEWGDHRLPIPTHPNPTDHSTLSFFLSPLSWMWASSLFFLPLFPPGGQKREKIIGAWNRGRWVWIGMGGRQQEEGEEEAEEEEAEDILFLHGIVPQGTTKQLFFLGSFFWGGRGGKER